MNPDWKNFYDAVEKNPPHETLLKALDFFSESKGERFAIDLGCGSGRDTLELLRQGWHVLAIDQSAEGIERLQNSVDAEHKTRLQTQVTSFEALQNLPQCNFINASNSLPFCTPAHFDTLWNMILFAIKPGGRFAGTFFGERDSWAQDQNKTFHTRSQVEMLLEAFKIEYFHENDSDGKTALGDTKHWHVFEIVALKQHRRDV